MVRKYSTKGGSVDGVFVLQVRTKTLSQCVELYYLSKKLQDKQKKQREEEIREAVMEQQKNVRNTKGNSECRSNMFASFQIDPFGLCCHSCLLL